MVQTAIALLMGVIGIIYLGRSFIDMKECNLIVYSYPKHFKKEGCEVPLPFVMKNLSLIALSCRNPLMTGQLLALGAPLIYPTAITLGRLHMSALFIIGTLMGVYFEQRELRRSMGEKEFARYASCIPNALIPAFGVFLKNKTDIEKLRKEILEPTLKKSD